MRNTIKNGGSGRFFNKITIFLGYFIIDGTVVSVRLYFHFLHHTYLYKFGFPKSHAPKAKFFQGFQTGDLVSASIPKGKFAGQYVGRIARAISS